MKKRICLVLLAALLASAGLAACNKPDTPPVTTALQEPSTDGPSIPWEEPEQTGSASSPAPATSPSTTGSTSSGGAQKGQHTVPKAPSLPFKGDAASGEEAFTSLSQLKALAGKHTSAGSGFELMRQKRLLLPTGAFYEKEPGDKDYSGSFDSQKITYGFSYQLQENPSAQYSVRYVVLQKPFASRDMRDCIADSTLNRCRVAALDGVEYYYVEGSEDGEDTVTVYSFYEDYCVAAVFFNPPLEDNGKFPIRSLHQQGFFQYTFTKL